MTELLGVDCEMAATVHDDRALVGVGVVDAQGETVLDTLVLPPHKVRLIALGASTIRE